MTLLFSDFLFQSVQINVLLGFCTCPACHSLLQHNKSTVDCNPSSFDDMITHVVVHGTLELLVLCVVLCALRFAFQMCNNVQLVQFDNFIF